MKEGYMLAYAANRPAVAVRQSSPNALLFVIAAHVAAVAAVMSVKMDLPRRIFPPSIVTSIPLPPIPKPNPVPTPPAPHTSNLDRPTVVPSAVDIQPAGGISSHPEPTAGGSAQPVGEQILPQKPVIARSGPQLLTPAAELRPPYPQAKPLTEEEAVLQLRLTIDERGRVVAVDPVGPADGVFLGAARRYLIAHWRFRPASEDGRAVSSSTVITLRFQLDG
jgi:protein TonB